MTTLTQSSIGSGSETMETNNFRTKVYYATLSTMTNQPGAPMQVLNPNDAPYQAQMAAFKNGKLNPNQANYPDNYYSITTAYGQEPVNLYASRVCSSSKIQS